MLVQITRRLRSLPMVVQVLLALLAVGLAVIIYGSGVPEQGSVPEPREATIEEETREDGEASLPGVPTEPMRATYYAEEFTGAPTASGEPYDPNSFTAAHRYLPLGTRLRVSYDGRNAVVTVNDRVPYESGHDLDLSLSAAREIRILDQGTAVVDAEVLED